MAINMDKYKMTEKKLHEVENEVRSAKSKAEVLREALDKAVKDYEEAYGVKLSAKALATLIKNVKKESESVQAELDSSQEVAEGILKAAEEERWSAIADLVEVGAEESGESGEEVEAESSAEVGEPKESGETEATGDDMLSALSSQEFEEESKELSFADEIMNSEEDLFEAPDAEEEAWAEEKYEVKNEEAPKSLGLKGLRGLSTLSSEDEDELGF